jgi:putative hydrolase of HD superfamily
METPAALCAAVVDRLQPLALNHASRGRMWKAHGVTADQVRKRNKVTFERGPARLAAYVDEVIAEATRLGHFPREDAPAKDREEQQ